MQGRSLMPGSVFTEAFSQCSFYGNGYYYLVVLPDAAVEELPVLYSFYAAVTAKPVNVSTLVDSCEGLTLRNTSSAKGDARTYLFTMLVDPKADYLSGKWAEKESMSYRYSFLICLFYLAVILVITEAAVLSVQLLGDGEKKMRQDRLLWQLGMKEREIDALNRRQLLMLFAFPAVPALAVSSALICMGAKLMDRNGLSLFPDAGWIRQCVIIAWILFGVLYGIYYAAVCGSDGSHKEVV